MKRLLPALVALAASLALAVGLSSAPAATHSGGGVALVATGSSSLGRIVVDGRGRTLYLFEKDKRGRSSCAGLCASYWPPLVTRGKPVAVRGAEKSLLGVTRRSDGRMQVTYAGHPVYRFVLDMAPGQAKGEGSQDFGAGWDALTPAGKKIESDG